MTTAALAPAVHPEWWREAPPTGLHRGVSYDEYARWAGINHSILRLFGRSALHARHGMLHPSDPTPAQALGSALHKAILEPDLFPKTYCAAPKFDKRFKDQRAAWEEFREANKDKEIITIDEYDRCIAMRDATWSHREAADILRAPGGNEVSAVWVDPKTGLPCKGRQDRFCSLRGWPTVVDVKSTEDAGRRAFSSSIAKYGYAEQAAMYLDGFDVLSPFQGDRRFVFIVIEKDPPHAVAVYELDVDTVEVGRKRYRAHLDEYARCIESGNWPGYPDGCDLISLPVWDMREE